MPYEDPDPADPMTLQGMMFETDDADAIGEMAACFVEEYIRLGFAAARILEMFQDKRYVGPYGAYQMLGEKAISLLIDETAQRWGPQFGKPSFDRNADGEIVLPVLDA